MKGFLALRVLLCWWPLAAPPPAFSLLRCPPLPLMISLVFCLLVLLLLTELLRLPCFLLLRALTA